MNPFSMAIVFGALFCTVAGQLLFRGAAIAANANGTFFNMRSMVGYATAITLYMVMTVLWSHALREMTLSKAYPFMALAFLILPVAEHFLYGQTWSWNAVVGGAIIVVGVIVTQL
jgi:multidrug transporter EmrE-like cation transporter